jgi:hypothetical protein
MNWGLCRRQFPAVMGILTMLPLSPTSSSLYVGKICRLTPGVMVSFPAMDTGLSGESTTIEAAKILLRRGTPTYPVTEFFRTL